ncbi:hypothetical protein L1987_88713 [Smallanthus sonchifolius]|nr:hypothetical protein L1987_88713 [Smallanthus sonchifolius]
MATLFESHSNVPSAEPGIFNFDVAIGSSSGCALSPIHGSNPQVMRPESRDLLLQQVQEKTERIGLLLKLGLLLVRTSDLVALKAEEEAPNAVKSCAALLDTPVEDAPLEKAVSASAFPAPSFYPQLYSEGEGQTLLLYGNSDLTMKDLSHSSVGALVSKRLEYPAYPATRATKTTATPATSLPMTDSPEKAVDTATDSFSSTDSAGDSFSYSLPTSSSSALA